VAPSDYSLFLNLKKHLRGRRFSSYDEFKGDVSQWFEEEGKDFYFSEISSLPAKCRNFVELQGRLAAVIAQSV
jgi:hypothetical protein